MVIGAGRYFKPPNLRIYVRRDQPCLRGSMGACFPIEEWTLVIGLFPREGTRGCSCVVLIYSDPYYSSLKVVYNEIYKKTWIIDQIVLFWIIISFESYASISLCTFIFKVLFKSTPHFINCFWILSIFTTRRSHGAEWNTFVLLEITIITLAVSL